MRYRSIAISLLVTLPVGLIPLSAQSETALRLSQIASGLSEPLFVTSPPSDTTRLFVVERGGLIKIIKNGTLLEKPFLNCSTLVTTTGLEQGLLGLAFHPSYRFNRFFYVNYTRASDGATVISRFQTSSANLDTAVLSSEQELLVIPQPFPNHNGGMLAFGPDDGYLYIGVGDGGSFGDPGNRAQDSTELLGKILRIDVDRHHGSLIPPENPFVGRAGWREEIWAMGLRNPWRFGFDRVTGDVYIADVGQSQWEEIDFQRASSTGGENYGWHFKEGLHCYNPPDGCDTLIGLVDPVYEYSHAGGCSVSGGYVYRGCAIPDLQGTYFFGDYCTGHIWSFVYEHGAVTKFTDRTSELGTDGTSVPSFGEDARREMYVVDFSGYVYKIVPDGPPASCVLQSCCVGSTGNIDHLGSIDLQDLNVLVSYLVSPGTVRLPCPAEANMDGKGIVDLSDLSVLVNYLVGLPVTFPTCQ